MRCRPVWLAVASLLAGCSQASVAVVPAAAPDMAPRLAVEAAADGSWQRRLSRTLDGYLRHRPGRAAVAVYDRTNGVRFEYGGREPFLLASVAKVDILLTLLLKAQREHRSLTTHERELADRMIRRSDNDAAHDLYEMTGGREALGGTLRRIGVRHTQPGPSRHWGLTTSRPADQVKVLDRLTDPQGPVSPANRRFASRLMSSVTPSQAWGVGAVAPGAEVKNGWLPARAHGGTWTVNSVGRVTVNGRELLVAVLSDHSPTMDMGIATVERVARLCVRAFARRG
ncbi:serine hydrolase [Thermoactinospora rubra]|uniref:serine hydrolase n=1 Tax=Thermoactinospora rubra TaxID=1088767 RepID=UPI000A0F6B8E|nr:serine hydrolase [Thermoactinospora rubra]